MSITDAESVLILGAGVSEPFGIPLGAQLVDGIADQIDKEASAALTEDGFGRRDIDPYKVIEWIRCREWHKFPIYGTLIRSKLDQNARLTHEGAVAAHKEIQGLRSLLRDQTAETIDAFIAENPKIATLAKVALASMLLRATYESKKETDQALSARLFPSRILLCPHRRQSMPQTERNWIHLLVNLIRHGIDEGTVTPANKIKIITFNYDMILEHVLDSQFQNRETQLDHFSQYIEIHHVHGKVGKIEHSCNDPGQVAQEWALGISVVKEKSPPDDVLSARIKAREIIARARDIYAVGFSFAGPNCRLLGLHETVTTHGRRLIYSNYDGNRGIRESAKRYVSADVHEEIPGDWQRPMGVNNFIQAGFLGEPPG